MDTLTKHFWLFFTDPTNFTSDWLTNTNNIREVFSPIALFFIISIVGLSLISLCSLFFFGKSIITFNGLPVSFYGLPFLGYFPLLALFSKQNFSESLIFGYTIILFWLLMNCIAVLFLILILILLWFAITLIKKQRSNPINILVVFGSSCFVMLIATMANGLIFFTHITPALSLFFNMSGWIIILITMLYNIPWSLIFNNIKIILSEIY